MRSHALTNDEQHCRASTHSVSLTSQCPRGEACASPCCRASCNISSARSSRTCCSTNSSSSSGSICALSRGWCCPGRPPLTPLPALQQPRGRHGAGGGQEGASEGVAVHAWLDMGGRRSEHRGRTCNRVRGERRRGIHSRQTGAPHTSASPALMLLEFQRTKEGVPPASLSTSSALNPNPNHL